MSRISLAVAIILLAGSAAAREVPVSDVVYGQSGYAVSPVVATNGSNFLVAWTDLRSGHMEWYAARLTRDGRLLDPAGIRIGAGDAIARTLLWSGTSYVLLWSERVGNSQYAIKIARLSSEGVVVEAPRVLVADAHAAAPRFASSNGSLIVVGYERHSTEQRATLHVALLDRDGRVLTLDQRLPHGDGTHITISTNGPTFLAAWQKVFPSAAVEGVRLDSSGAVLDTAPLTLAEGYGPSDGPLVASDGDGYLLLIRNVSSGELRSVRFGSDAARVDGASVIVAAGPRVVWTGESYMLIGIRDREVVALRLARDGSALGEPVTIDSAPPGGVVAAADVAAAGSAVLIAWSDTRLSPPAPTSPQYDVFAALVDASAPVRTPGELLSISAARQKAPAIAASGTGSFVAWAQNAGVFGGRISVDGRALDGRGVPLSNTTTAALSLTPATIFDGERYVVAWPETTSPHDASIGIATVDPHIGTVASRSSVPACAAFVALAPGPGGSMLVWADCTSRNIRAVRLDRGGNPIDAMPLDISPRGQEASEPSVAWSGSVWVVAWSALTEDTSYHLPVPVYRGDIRAARVSAGFTLLDPQPIAISTSTLENNRVAAVASDGRGFAVAWAASESAAAHIRIRGVSNSGILRPVLTIGTGVRPDLAWHGTTWFSAWQSGEAVIGVSVSGPVDAVVGPPIPIAHAGGAESDVALATAAGRPLIAAYARIADESPYGGVPRVFASEVLPPADVPPPQVPRRRSVRR